jgi:crossover junction endodeoxyribonuclease RuvC
MATYIGIDPGLKGGIVSLLLNGSAIYTSMPTKKGRVDPRTIADFFRALPAPCLVVIEKVGSRPDNGVVSMFTFGEGYGKILGVLETLNICYLEKTPRSWKDCVLSNTKKDKAAAISYCKNNYPSIDLLLGKKNEHDGIADAACIARYAQLIHQYNPKILKC